MHTGCRPRGMASMLTVFLIVVVEYLTRSNSRMEEMVLSYRSRDYSPSREGTRQEERKLKVLRLQSESREKSGVQLLFSLDPVRAPSLGNRSAVVRVGLPTLISLISKLPYRQTQRYIY